MAKRTAKEYEGALETLRELREKGMYQSQVAALREDNIRLMNDLKWYRMIIENLCRKEI